MNNTLSKAKYKISAHKKGFSGADIVIGKRIVAQYDSIYLAEQDFERAVLEDIEDIEEQAEYKKSRDGLKLLSVFEIVKLLTDTFETGRKHLADSLTWYIDIKVNNEWKECRVSKHSKPVMFSERAAFSYSNTHECDFYFYGDTETKEEILREIQGKNQQINEANGRLV